MISGPSCNRSWPPANPGQAKNPIPGLKKKCFDFYTIVFARGLPSISSRNRSLGGKILPIRATLGCSQIGEIPEEIGALVTTSHLFWQRQPRRTATLLPISQPNSNVLDRGYHRRAERGGGDHPERAEKSPKSMSSHRILCQMDSLLRSAA